MESAFRKLFDSMRLNRQKCPWAKEREMLGQVDELEGEVEELRAAIKNCDAENLEEEFGDVLWDLLFIGVLAEEKKLFSVKQALEKADAKFRRRKPWVFGNEKVKDAEEAVKRWYEIKAEEKAGKP